MAANRVTREVGAGSGRGRQAARLLHVPELGTVSFRASRGGAVSSPSRFGVRGQVRLPVIPSPRGHGALRPRSAGVNQNGDHATGVGVMTSTATPPTGT